VSNCDWQPTFTGQDFNYKTFEAGQAALQEASDHDFVHQEKIFGGKNAQLTHI
jgi:hypothetical protein